VAGAQHKSRSGKNDSALKPTESHKAKRVVDTREDQKTPIVGQC
jgi:hypothetical protein